MKTLQELRDIYAGERVFIIGKGPSLRNFEPFKGFEEIPCIGINNVYRYVPCCRYVLLWHAEFYEHDREYLEHQSDFLLIYSSFHRLPAGLANALDVSYAGDFPDSENEFGYLQHWKQHPDSLMFKTTFAAGVKLAWWMGADHITLLGFDFSLKDGRTAKDDLLNVEVPLQSFTTDEILERQARVYTHLRSELATDGVILDRVFNTEGIR